MSPVVELPSPEIANENAEAADAVLASTVARDVVQGTSALGLSVLIERGTSFLANILAARFAGVMVFGAYSLGVSTANNIATYASGGIGTTATRFSGRYSFQGSSYGAFARAMAVVAAVSAGVAAAALLLCAGLIAQLLHKPELTGLLRWAALSAAGMIVLECARGFFVGQRRIRALVALSLLVGAGMLLLVPAMALSHRAGAMLVAQGSTTLLAVAACLLLAGPLLLVQHEVRGSAAPFGTILRQVWSYGLIQLSGLLTANLAGWWVTILVARSDPSLAQMGFFAVASQLRNLAGLVPGLLTEGSFASMATEAAAEGHPAAGNSLPHRLMSVCTFVSTAVSMVLACAGIVMAPWLLRLVYGRAYGGAALAVAIGLSVAVLQMGNAPTSARVSIVSIRSTATINTTWAVLTALLGVVMLVRGGSAAGAMTIFLAAHVVMAVQVLAVLRRLDYLPDGLVALLTASTLTMLALCGLAALEAKRPQDMVWATVAMLAVMGASALYLQQLARRHGWLRAMQVRAMAGKVVRRFR